MENKETTHKIFLMTLGFLLTISAFILASTTAIFIYPTVYEKAYIYLPQYAVLISLLASFVVALAIDGMAGLFYPSGIAGIFTSEKGRALYIIITVLGLCGYAASGTFSIWMAPLAADVIVQEPRDSSMVLYNLEDQTYNKGLDILDRNVLMAEQELKNASQSVNFSYLAAHSDPGTRKQLLEYINNPNTSNWATKTLKGRVREIDKAKAENNKRIENARKKLDDAIDAQSKYIADAGSSKDRRKSELKESYTMIINDYKDEKGTMTNNVIWIDIVMLLIIIFATPIRIYYNKINDVKMPRQMSLTFALYKSGIAIQNRLVWLIEFITRIDIDGDGVKGKPKQQTAPTTQSVLTPVRGASAFDAYTAERMIKVATDSAESRLNSKLQSDLEFLRLENARLESEKKSKPEKSKPAPQPFSLKEFSISKSKVIGIENVKGFGDLEKAARSELLKYESKILNSKPSLEDLSKAARNAFTAVLKSATKVTKAKNNVKLFWLCNVLEAHGQDVTIKGGKIKIKTI